MELGEDRRQMKSLVEIVNRIRAFSKALSLRESFYPNSLSIS